MPDSFETQVKQHASTFRYPPTPDLAAGLSGQDRRQKNRRYVRPRPAGWILVAVVLLAACSLLFAPGVRAQILEFLQIGAIRIFFSESTPTPQATASVAESALPLLVDILPGGTSLAEARQRAGFAFKMPAGPDSLGNPDEIYVLETGSPVVLLVWEAQEDLQRARTSLFIFGPENFAGKKITGKAQSAEVNGREALWISEPHAFEFFDSQERQVLTYYVADRVLLWWDDDMLTYRLEGNFTLEEALEIANSIQ